MVLPHCVASAAVEVVAAAVAAEASHKYGIRRPQGLVVLGGKAGGFATPTGTTSAPVAAAAAATAATTAAAVALEPVATRAAASVSATSDGTRS